MPEPDTRRRLNTDLIVSGAAIFISLCTLVVLLYEARIMREQQRASVWPYIELAVGSGNQGFHVVTHNQGIGPARIRSLRAFVDGTPVRTWDAMFDSLGVETGSWGNDLTNGRVIPGQSGLPTLRAAGAERAARLIDAYFDDQRLAFEVCYCSIYDECWRVVSRGLDEERTPVASCEADAAAEFKL